MTQTTEKHEFQAEVKEVLSLMTHSLYSNKEIFLRELISNASDALDKLRFKALADDSLLGGDAELVIELEADKEKRLLTIRDNGIGMSRDEVIENIGTIARSGTRRFLEQVKDQEGFDQNLIGQFGVGFYSAFIVADTVTLHTRSAGAEASEGVRWVSSGDGAFEISDLTLPRQGTEVVLHLKEGEEEFLEPWTLKSLVSRYSDHIGFPIRLKETVADEAVSDQDTADAEDGDEGADKAPVSEWKTINQASALWTLPKSEISEEDYTAFYQHLSHDMEAPLAHAHNQVEGAQNYVSLLYLPGKAPLDFMLQRDERSGLKLYVKRVFIMDAAEQLLPHYLRFVRGVVDSDDLPLNVSRELLQENEALRKIRGAVVRRSLDLIERLAKNEPERFTTFWSEFGTVLKEGIVEDLGNQAKIAGLLRFTSTKAPEEGDVVSLADYLERMPEDQDTIWYVTADNLKSAQSSPHLEVFRKQGIEVLLMHERIDEWMMGYFQSFEGKTLRSVAKGEVNLDDAADDGDTEEKPELLERMEKALGEQVAAVRVSKRLTDSASCLVLNEQEMALHLRRMLEQAGQPIPDSKPTLEVNLSHPLLERLGTVTDEAQFDDLSHLLLEQAVLAEGGQLDDPAAFVGRLNRLVLAG